MSRDIADLDGIRRSAVIVCELFKLLRFVALTREEIMRETGLSQPTVAYWCRELEAQGLLVARPIDRSAHPLGRQAKVYALSPQWGGTDAA